MSAIIRTPDRHLLLAVTGMSPQVITETLYAIHRDGEPWPQQIRVITTTQGKHKVWQGLHTDGHLQALADQLGLPVPTFSQRDIRVIPGAGGQPVDDARSLDDHEALADFITHEVRKLTADAGLAIHASIAGGRKTMTFYLGYAMSLFGRVQDRLSHVLVSGPYENRPDFYYPTHTPCPLARRPGETEALDAQKAEVTLADIPFVRQRAMLPAFLQQSLGRQVSYRELTALINLADSPEQLQLSIHEADAAIEVRERQRNRVNVRIPFPHLLSWAFYLIMVDATLEGDNSLNRPASPAEGDLLGMLMLQRLYQLLGIKVPASARTRDLANELLENDHYLPHLGSKKIPVNALEALRTNNGFTTNTFDNYCNRIRKVLSDQLPGQLVSALTPGPVQPLIDHNNPEQPPKGKRSKLAGYGLNLPDPQQQIQFIKDRDS